MFHAKHLAVKFSLLTMFAVAAPAVAQVAPFQVAPYNPYASAQQMAFNSALYNRAAANQAIANTVGNPYMGGGSLVNNPTGVSPIPPVAPGLDPYSGYNTNFPSNNYPWGWPWSDPVGGYLRGQADLIAAGGQFRVNQQKSNLLQEQLNQMRIDTKRRAFDEFMYERANTPTPQEERERRAQEELRYQLVNPTNNEVHSGITLNTIMDQLQQMQARGQKSPDVKLNEDLLKQINVTTGRGNNPALLKSDGRLSFPNGLSDPKFDTLRKSIEGNLQRAVSEVSNTNKPPTFGLLKDLTADVDKLDEQTTRSISDMGTSRYIEARSYIRLLRDAINALSQTDAAGFVNGKYPASGRTVGELVKNMTGKQFAPAAPGEEQAYHELYQALRSYYYAAQPSRSEAPPLPRP
jgi:hypothetical protein